MDRFKVGDRVRIIDGCRRGLSATIMSPKTVRNLFSNGEIIKNVLCYRLDVDGEGEKARSGRHISYREHKLVTLYDGYEKTTWDECVWRPKILEKV